MVRLLFNNIYFGVLACLLIITLCPQSVMSQKLFYSHTSGSDFSGTRFEIIGKQGNGYWIYKNKHRNHYLCRYDHNMVLTNEKELDILPDKIIDLDIYTGNSGIMLICQFKKNQWVYCQFIRMDTSGLLTQKPFIVDSTSIGNFSDSRIYSSVCSDDKKKLLVYKRHIQSGVLRFSSFLLNNEGLLLERYAAEEPFRKNESYLGDCVLANSGDWAYLQEQRKNDESDVYEIDIKIKKQTESEISVVSIPLNGNWMSQPKLKVDNRNNRWLTNAFYRLERKGRTTGLFTVVVDQDLLKMEQYNPFANMQENGLNQYALSNITFDNLLPEQILVKKNGGFLLIAEDNYSETYSNQNWNRDYYYNQPFNNYGDYFYNSRPYGIYRPFDGYGNNSSTRYHSGDLLMLSLDSNLILEWSNVISKKQADTDNENFLSFGLLNAGKDLHLFFLGNMNQKDLVNHQAVSSTGQVSRYPAWKSDAEELQFMPTFTKQTGVGEMIMPYIFQNKLGFALVDFTTP